jgi:two-component system nitrate/nitrite response regulator NarL
VEDALSGILVGAGFSVSGKTDADQDLALVIVEFDICDDPDLVLTYQARGAKIVALADGIDGIEIDDQKIGSLSGILTYDLSADAFVQSLRLICAGERVFPRELAGQRKQEAPSSAAGARSDDSRLSPREREVLSHLVDGHSNKAIGRLLGMTEATVKVHLKSVLRKIRVENRTQAAIWALSHLPERNTK